jgi:hypothetical protein
MCIIHFYAVDAVAMKRAEVCERNRLTLAAPSDQFVLLAQHDMHTFLATDELAQSSQSLTSFYISSRETSQPEGLAFSKPYS